MFIGRLSRWLPRHSTRVLVVALLAAPLLALVAAGVKDHLSVGGFVNPSAPSAVTAARLERVFGTGAPNEVLIAEPRHGAFPDATNVTAAHTLLARLRAVPGVVDVISPWDGAVLPPGAPNPLLARGGGAAAVALRLAGDEGAQRRTATIVAHVASTAAGLRVLPTGPAEVSRATVDQAEIDLRRAEAIALPLTLLGLLLVFRGWRPALIPLAVAVLAVLGALSALVAVAELTTVSVFSLNLVTALGLGLAVDYSLLLVARFREERAAGADVTSSVERTVETAGRTVALSAVTVAVALLALLVFPFAYLRSFAFGGIAVVLAAAATAVVVVPAALHRFGHRLGVADRADGSTRFWSRQARRVMGRPVLWALGAAAVLVAAGIPFLGVRPGRIDDRVLPASAPARAGADQLRQGFAFGALNPIAVMTSWIEPGDTVAVHAFAAQLAHLPGVERVDSASGFATARGSLAPTAYNERFRAAASGQGTWFSVVTDAPPDSDAARHLVGAIRRLDPRAGVAGATAAVVDAVDQVGARIPLALAIVAVTTLALLFLMTGSVLVPVKALVLNLLSLSATFGVLVFVFQDGHLASALGVTATGRIDVFTPILVFCVAFGLSMDYEVFLLARIKEHHDRHRDGPAAIAAGLGSTGRLVTAAAGLLTIVFVAIATSGVATVKMIGTGLAVAVVVDAFVVRATLVPALMRLAGRANWWAPAPLRRLHLRCGVWECEPLDLPVAVVAPVLAPEPEPSWANRYDVVASGERS